MRISDWSSDVCSSDLEHGDEARSFLARAGKLKREPDRRHGRCPRELAARPPAPQPEARERTEPAIRKGRDAAAWRSEERRVGKEWVRPGRSRWSPDH